MDIHNPQPFNTLRVGVVVKTPFVEACVDQLPKFRKRCPRPGISFEIFELIINLLGFKKYTVVKVKTEREIFPNRTYGGLMGMLGRRELDIAGTLLTITDDSDDNKLVDYSIPLATAPTGLIMLDTGDTATRKNLIDGVLEPFGLEVWLCILLTVVVVQTLSNILRVVRSKITTKYAERILLLTKTAIFYFFMFRSYKSNLYVVFMAKPVPKLAFNASLEGFVDALLQKRVSLATYDGSSMTTDIAYGDLKAYRQIREFINSSSANQQYFRTFKTSDEMLGNVSMTPNLVFRMSQASFVAKIKTSTNNQCNLTWIPAAADQYLAFAFPKRSVLAKNFSRVLYTIGHSAEDWNKVFIDRYIRAPLCADGQSSALSTNAVGKINFGARSATTQPVRRRSSKKSTKKQTALSLKKMKDAFVFLFLGLVVATALNICEVIYGYLTQTKLLYKLD